MNIADHLTLRFNLITISAARFDKFFQQAVSAIDAGDENTLKELLDTHPELSIKRLNSPGKWLTKVIDKPLKSFFKEPYLLWFVSEDAIRNGKLPKNIATIASTIIQHARSQDATNLQEQLDYALKLVAWSVVARKEGVQIELLDVLANAGADINNANDDALVNGNFDAARYLIERGGKLTLSSALCLERWKEADQLATDATDEQKQFSFVLAALNGKADAVAKSITYGVDIN